MPRLEGKIALITGGASGIGAAAAALFAREGAVVYASDRVAGPLAPLPAGVTYVAQDVTDEARWPVVVNEIFDRHGKLDILVNNAGIQGEQSAIDEASTEGWRHCLEINLTAAFFGMRAVIPLMKRSGGGSIINVSSIWGNVSSTGIAPYHASKGGIRHLTKNGAVTYATDNIRVNSIHPGLIITPMVAVLGDTNNVTVSRTPMGRPGKPDEIAYGMLYLASDESSYVTGAELVIDGGHTAQ